MIDQLLMRAAGEGGGICQTQLHDHHCSNKNITNYINNLTEQA